MNYDVDLFNIYKFKVGFKFRGMENMKNIRKYLITVFILLLAFIVSSCTKEVNSIDYSGESQISINDLKDFKKPFQISKDNIEEYIDENQTSEKMITLLGKVKFEGENKPYKELSMEEVKEDLDKYFSYLKGSYAGYLANGGDDRFLKAKENIIDNISDGMKASEFKNLLEEELSYVDDAHFTIWYLNKRTEDRAWYVVENFQLFKDKKGLYSILDDSYIENGDKLNDFLKPSITSEGKACYILMGYRKEIEEAPKSIKLSNGEEKNIVFKRIKNSDDKGEEPVYKDIDGIKYLKFPSVYFPVEEKETNIVLKAAKEMKESPVSILDLRGNPGGNGILADQWVETYSGEKTFHSYNGIYILSEQVFKNDRNGQKWDDYIEASGAEIYDDSHVVIKASDKIINNDNLLIVLTDNRMASASEMMVDGLHHLKKTVFIGMPTSGCLNSSLMLNAYLDNSNIPFGHGNSWNVFHPDYFQEFKGFQPDIWIEEVNVEELVKVLLY